MIHGSSSFLFCFYMFYIGLNATCMVHFISELSQWWTSKHGFAACCVSSNMLHSHTYTGFHLCLWGWVPGEVPYTSCPTAHASLESKLSEWLWGHSGANNLRSNWFVFNLSYLLTLQSRGTASLSTFSQMLCLTCVMLCHRSFLSVTVSIFLYFLHLLDDTTRHILSIHWYIQENKCWRYEAPAWSVGYSL